MNSESVEDYLKAIYGLEAQAGRAKTSALARQLGLTAGSVTDMLKRLAAAENGLITYKHHQGVRLTPKGKSAALDVIRRHRLTETFLHTVLDLKWHEVHVEAERLEHHLSDRVTDAIDKLLGYPRFDPHGEPIPDNKGKLPTLQQRQLSETEIGTAVRLVRVEPFGDDLLPYLDSLGLGIGTEITVTAKAPFEGPISLRIGGREAGDACGLGRTVADRIYVEPI